MARLNTTIHVYDGVDTVVYLPGQEVLPEHRGQITAPGVWEGELDPVDEHDASLDLAVVEKFDTGIPPKAGAGASLGAWQQYAERVTKAAGLKIDIPADAKRADIIEALNTAGIPTG